MPEYDNIIIQIREGIDVNIALQMVNSVVANGRNERGRFDFKTDFNTLKGEVHVYARQYTKKDSFVVSRDGTLRKDDLQ